MDNLKCAAIVSFKYFVSRRIYKKVALLIGVYGQISIFSQELPSKAQHKSSIPFLPEIHKMHHLERKALKQQAMNATQSWGH